MEIYQQHNWWKRLLLFAAALIIAFSLIYTNKLAKRIAVEEIKRVEKIANAYKSINDGNEAELEASLEVIQSNSLIPIIITDANNSILLHKNFETEHKKDVVTYLSKHIKRLNKKDQKINIDYIGDTKQYIYYRESNILRKIRLFPLIQLALISMFLAVAYVAFSASRRAEQNRVWVGMAKETAHQLGTPISSLSAWMDLLDENALNRNSPVTVSDMKKDVERLELVAERFSKIGSKPDLERIDIFPVVIKVVDYMARRAPKKVEMTMSDNLPNNTMAYANAALLDWVLENLLKNALDALEEGKGRIQIFLEKENGKLSINIKDTGKGISKSQLSNIFKPGFSTKKRGWGLGLALCKRIVEEYHHGKIFVRESVIDEGTTFAIELNT